MHTPGAAAGQLKRGFIFRDPTYASPQNEIEQSIRAQINQARAGAAAQQASTGARTSGKLVDELGKAEARARQSTLLSRGMTTGLAQERFQDILGRLEQVPLMRSDIAQQRIPAAFQTATMQLTGAQPTDLFGRVTGTDFDITGLNLAQQNYEDALTAQILSNYIQGVMQTTGQIGGAQLSRG
jgi:hypothetical protein